MDESRKKKKDIKNVIRKEDKSRRVKTGKRGNKKIRNRLRSIRGIRSI
jgi:hypothetical protein